MKIKMYKFLLENMWSNEAAFWATVAEDSDEQSFEDAKQYLSIESRKVSGVCGGNYKSQFMKTRHSSRKITATLNHYGLKVHRLFYERLKVVPVKLQG